MLAHPLEKGIACLGYKLCPKLTTSPTWDTNQTSEVDAPRLGRCSPHLASLPIT